MNIVLLTENWAPRVGGIENYLQQLTENLPTGSVQVFAPQVPQNNDQPRGGIRSIKRERFFWPLVKPAWLPFYLRLRRQAKQEPIDILLCGKAMFEGLVGYYLKKQLGIPYVVFTYAMEIETWSANKGLKKKLQRVLKNADRVVYINDITKKKLLDLGVEEKQLVKIWPGVDEQYFTSVNEDQIKETLHRYHIRQPYILSVARLIPRKGLDTLIEGFSHLDQTKFGKLQLVIVGDGPGRANLEAATRDEFIDRSVIFLGNTPQADLPTLYQGAQLFALTPRQLPGDMEGFGIVYIESAASGLAALATQSGGASEAVIHQETGIVIPSNDPVAVTKALTRLLNDDFRKPLAAKAKARAIDQFRWPKRSLLVKGVLDAIMAERPLK